MVTMLSSLTTTICQAFIKDQGFIPRKVKISYFKNGLRVDSSIQSLHIFSDKGLGNVPKWKHGKVQNTIMRLKNIHVVIDILFQFANSNFKH